MQPAIRSFDADRDTLHTALLYHAAVRDGATAYTVAQRRAWSPDVPETGAWRARLTQQTVLCAEGPDGLVGFMSFDASGLLDLAFVAPEAAGRGVGSALLAATEEAARKAGLARLTTDASHMLAPLLRRRGWSVLDERIVERRGVTLANTRMEKMLTPL